MSDNNIKNIMDTTMNNLRSMVDADIIVGSPVTVGEHTLLPVCNVAFGLATGGSDFPSKSQKEIFGGGGGAGVTITPIAFMAINGSNIKMMPIYNELTTVEKAISMTPEIIEKAKELFAKNEK